MSNETKQPDLNATPESDAQPKAASKSGLIKYIIFGVAGLVIIGGVAFGTLLLLGGGNSSKAPAEDEAKSETNSTGKTGSTRAMAAADTLPAEDSLALLNDDSLLAAIMAEADGDSSILDDVQAQLNYLDVADTQNLDMSAESHADKADSAKETSWLTEQRDALTKREKELAEREHALEIRDKKIQQQITRLEQAESARVTNLAKLYDGMEARQVAELMANLDDETVVSVLPRMKPKNASQVLGLMPPARAAKLSKQMITIAGTE